MKILEQAKRFYTFAIKQPCPTHYLKHMLRYTPDVPTQAAYILALRCVNPNETLATSLKPALDYLNRIDLTTFKAASADSCRSMPMPNMGDMLGQEGCRHLKVKREREGYGVTTTQSNKGRTKNRNTVSRFDQGVHF